MKVINDLPANEEALTIYSAIKGATLEKPIKTKTLKRITGLNERELRGMINTLRFYYSVPVGSIRHKNNNGYYFIRSEDDLIACIAPIKAQASQELRIITQLKENLENWRDNDD